MIVTSEKGKEVDPTAQQLSGLEISPTEQRPIQPPRPAQQPEEYEPDIEEEDENDPFGDSNAIETPAVEKGEPDWG